MSMGSWLMSCRFSSNNSTTKALFLHPVLAKVLYDTKLPIRLQKLVSATLGSLAEALGYRATYPRFVGNG